MFTKRIDDLLAKNKLCRADIERGTGIGESTIRGWYKGRVPSAESLLKVAQYFNVSVEWLLTGEDYLLSDREPFSREERNLIDMFRNLSPEDKELTLRLACRLDAKYNVQLNERNVAN